MAILRLLAVTVGGQLFHTIRRSNGSWLAFKDVEQGAGHFGDVNRVTAVQLHAELHVIAVPSPADSAMPSYASTGRGTPLLASKRRPTRWVAPTP
jgi:hypothetical protein